MNLWDAKTPRDITRAIVFDGVKPNTKNENGEPALLNLVRKQAPLPVLKELVRLGGDIGRLNQQGYSVLALATLHRDPRVIEWLIEKGACHRAPQLRHAPLHVASFKGQSHAVRVLLEYGASPHHMGPHGRTALFCASTRDVAHQLIQAGSNPFQRDLHGQTAVEAWKQHGHHDLLAALGREKPRLYVVGG